MKMAHVWYRPMSCQTNTPMPLASWVGGGIRPVEEHQAVVRDLDAPDLALDDERETNHNALGAGCRRTPHAGFVARSQPVGRRLTNATQVRFTCALPERPQILAGTRLS